MHRLRVLYVTVLLLFAVVTPLSPIGTAAAGNAPADDGCAFPFSSIDATGTNVTVPQEPERVVTLNPSAAQTMWEIGAKKKVVGVSGYASYLEGADTRTNVHPAGTAVQTEEVVALRPDLVVAPNIIVNDTVEQLRDAGLTVYRFESATSIESIYDKTILTGQLVGECDGAQERTDRMREEVQTIRDATEGVERPGVIYTFYSYTAGEDTFIDEIITTAGGRNVAAEAGISGYRPLNAEVLVERDPEWILRNSDNPTVPDTAAYDSTTAVKENQTIVVNNDYINQAAPRTVQPMLKIVKALHPDAYRRAKQGVEAIRDNERKNVSGPSFSIESTTLNASRVELHDTQPIAATISNDGGPGTFEATLTLNGSAKAIEYVHVPAGGSATVRFQHTFSAIGRYVVQVNDQSAGTVTVVWDLANESVAANTTTSTPSPTPSPTPTSTAAATPTPATPATSEPTPVETTPGSTTPQATPRTTEPPVTAAAPTQTGGQPGFGPWLAAAAIGATGLLARRRS